MAYVFLNDGSPDATDYDNNFFYFDESNSISFKHLNELLSSHVQINEELRNSLRIICRASFKTRHPYTLKKRLTFMIKNFLKNKICLKKIMNS
jgi:hypothetical protein